VDFLANEISPDTHVNIMAQYHPCYEAYEIPSVARRISPTEFQEALTLARQAGLGQLDKASPVILKL